MDLGKRLIQVCGGKVMFLLKGVSFYGFAEANITLIII